jgi:hypothetical protein
MRCGGGLKTDPTTFFLKLSNLKTQFATEDDIMERQKERTELISRRSLLKGSAAFLVGGTVGCLGDKVSPPAAAPTAGNPPPLPWPWVKLDPLEAGRRAYRSYLKQPGG